jgi:uncharacterized protein (DUF736 family)
MQGFLFKPIDSWHVSKMLFGAREHLASHWLDLAEGRLRLDRLNRNGGGDTFFPWASPIPREARKSHRRHPPLRCGPSGCGVDRLRLPDRHRGRGGRGARNKLRRIDMANIGSFKKSGQEFQGEIVTLSLQTKGVRIVPETDRTNDNAPSHRVYVGRAEIGAAWSKRSSEGRDYLSVKLDDPSFNAPIYANLFDDEDAETFTLIWSRSRKANGD